MISESHDHRPLVDFFELLYDLCLVWALEIRSRLAAVESDSGFVGDRAV
jgi:hypothetical protein